MELPSDQERNFDSQVFQKMCDTLGIRKTRTYNTVADPQSGGMIERFIKTLKSHLRMLFSEHQMIAVDACIFINLS